MKLTTRKLKQMIKEELQSIVEMEQTPRGTQFSGNLAVTTEPLKTQSFDGRDQTHAERKMGHWTIKGEFNGQPISISSKKVMGRPDDIEQWEDLEKTRYAMARTLLGYFGKNNPQFRVRAFDLNNVTITVNVNEAKLAKVYR